MGFMNDLKDEANNTLQATENGAVGYKTTGKQLLDLNFNVSSLRNKSDAEIENKFVKAFYEDKLVTIKWLFYLRDREALGERHSFRVIMKYLASNHIDIARAVVNFIPEYGRWDDLWILLDTELRYDIVKLVKYQLNQDAKNMMENKPISLLAKWMPSLNATSYETKAFAKDLRKEIGMTNKHYRTVLSKLRKYLKVVEVSMSAKKWNEINYSTVPSRANLIYNKAFLRNDETRRREYLAALERGDKNVKINASVLFPHDIVHKYTNGHAYVMRQKDQTNEALWKALPDYVKGQENTICVADGSWSMTSKVGGTKISCLDVANALAIYFAEHSSGEFKNKYITFSMKPQFVDLSNGNSLKEKLEIAFRHDECANTNIEAVFDLILNTAVKKKMKQEDIPSNILILSDMEFDGCVYTNSLSKGYYRSFSRPSKTLFDEIANKYAEYGYKLPRIIFWNICSRTGTIPVKENDMGVALVSGFSPSIVKMVLSNKTDPYECLLEQLNTERYTPIENAVKELLA